MCVARLCASVCRKEVELLKGFCFEWGEEGCGDK